ncbi:uncharacterized protein [Penaeus vannamei]|uniref:uncharacterized protein n=1 Tax=Penaeus vannamei TaxID=6689 RepID=UPI00387F99A7
MEPEDYRAAIISGAVEHPWKRLLSQGDPNLPLRVKTQDSKQELGFGFLVHRRLAKNIVEFCNVSERVASITIKLNNRYYLKIVQVYVPPCSHSDEDTESFYEDVYLASERIKTQFTIIMGDFNAKIDSLLSDEDLNTNQINKQFNDIIKEAALDVRKTDKRSSSKISTEANAVTRDVPNIIAEEIKRAIKGIKRGKTPGGNRIGFRSGFSTTDHIHMLAQIREKINEYRKLLCMPFIDYTKAFDSIQIPALLEAIRRKGVEDVYSCLEEIFKKPEWNRKGIKIGDEYLI